ncbi:MAG TPA: ComF family protein [Terriglobia bacterium]|nr:ComF family protein [Terriglobia bacterium]
MRVADDLQSSSSPTPFFREFAQNLLALILPGSCAVCAGELNGSPTGGICGDCWGGLEPWNGAICSRCGLPLAARLATADFLCGECRVERPQFDFGRSYGIYGGKLRAAVLELKFHRRELLGVRLGHLLLQPWLALCSTHGFSGSWAIIPVPLHRSRERERGYNQAALLARGLSRALRKHRGSAPFRLDTHVLTRERSTVPQSGLSVQARHENVRRVFSVLAPNRLRGRDVILVDDVLTTGATASACAAELKRCGAQRVVVLTLARATPQFPDVARP